ncbi:MAG: hypothetical protein PHZ07_01075 [Patescibacteria group bacterium]|nr:hypothetical protein [Patescibacteria group bacterium]MDD4303970.1 hypothetical protein [Patescibacteria group bacterium]MDD4695041.1 hypothetical protein [Patescibacteria group bacterium]
MKNKIIMILLFFIITITTTFLIIFDKKESQLTEKKYPKQIKIKIAACPIKIKIAACPTCYELLKNIDNNKYEIIRTNSTSESIELLENKLVDIILGGRTLKPEEPKLDSLVISDGYSFLGNQEITIYIDELKKYSIYTDLDIESIKNNISIQKIKKVDNIYDYLDKGIVITSWENTDYTKAKIVHVLEDNGNRLKLSRRPTVYCNGSCYNKINKDLINNLIINN